MTWYRNPKIISAIIFLLLILLIWFAGSSMGLVSPAARLAAIFFIILLWVVILVMGKVVRERSSSLLEKMLRRKADDAVVSANPENRAEVALLRQRLLGAIETLKTSNLGKTRGKAALYELPWYMIVGHPSAGKSCAILNSGLKFPLATKGGGTAIKGIGGTRNCDWFFSTEGVLLDTAGRYSTQAEDRVEWLEFLKLLKKHRPKSPLNGIMIGVSFPELLEHQTESFTNYARQIRQRINEVDDTFGMKVPVYLVFTKLDLLLGFTQFFEDMREEERQQVWGATLTHEQGENFDAVKVIGQEFDALYKGLAQLGIDKLASSRANQNRPALFAFPLEFHSLKDAVCKFVEHLTEQDPYHTKPLIRGFYFTSALQETGPGISSVNRVTNKFDLTKFGFIPSIKTGSQPYFLESLFRKVIFPDLFLAGRMVSPKRNRSRIMGIAAGLAGLALLVGCWTWSFVGNQKLIDEGRLDLLTAKKQSIREDLKDKLLALQILQYRIEQLYQYRKDGRPWGLGWGLYQGDDVEATLRAEYFAGIRKLMLDPVKLKLEERLEKVLNPQAEQQGVVVSATTLNYRPNGIRSSTSAATTPRPSAPIAITDAKSSTDKGLDTYNALKTYLMLHDRKRMESAHLTDQISRYWQPWLEEQADTNTLADILRKAERIVGFYVKQIHEPDIPTITNRDELVSQIRVRLGGDMDLLPRHERIYNELKAQGNTRFPPMTVAAILNNKDMDLVGASVAVSGSLTREAWDKFFREAMEEAAQGKLKATDWVLGSSIEDSGKKGEPEEVYTKLEALYKADYIKEWGKFLQGVDVRQFSDLGKAAEAMGRFGDPQNSPLKLILTRVVDETAWDNPSELNKSLSKVKNSVIQRTQLLLGGGTSATDSANPRFGEVGGRFAALAAMVAAPSQGGRAPIDGYLELLLKVRGKLAGLSATSEAESTARQLVQATLNASGSELAEAQQFLDVTLLGRMDDTSKDVVRPILVRPLLEAFRAVIPSADQDLNRAWSQQVYSQWGNLAAKYPFADSPNEAQMSDIVKFLKPGDGTLARFIDKYLNGLVTRRGEVFAARSWAGQGINFSPNFLNGISRLTEAGNVLFQDTESSRFDIIPDSTYGISEIIIEIDGKQLRYRNEPPKSKVTQFTWPGSTTQGARIQAINNSGITKEVLNASGRLGLMRLLDQAKIDNPSSTTSSLVWELPKEFNAKPIRCTLNLVSGINPLRLKLLRHHSLPPRVGN